jgi:hypothetical protein
VTPRYVRSWSWRCEDGVPEDLLDDVAIEDEEAERSACDPVLLPEFAEDASAPCAMLLKRLRDELGHNRASRES